MAKAFIEDVEKISLRELPATYSPEKWGLVFKTRKHRRMLLVLNHAPMPHNVFSIRVLRRGKRGRLTQVDKVFVSFSGTYDLHLQTDFYREVHKWVDGLGSVTNSNYFAPSEELQSIAAKIVA